MAVLLSIPVLMLQDVMAQVEPVAIKSVLILNERGETTQNLQWWEELDNGKFQIRGKYKANLTPYIADNNKNFVNDIVTETRDIIQIESATASIVYDKNACAMSVFEGGMITLFKTPLILSDSWIVETARTGGNNWIIDPVNNEKCITILIENRTGTFIESTKQDSASLFVVTHAKYDDTEGIETILKITNEDFLRLDQKFGFTQSIILNSDVTIQNDPDNSRIFITNGTESLILGYKKARGQLWNIDTTINDRITFDYKNSTQILGFGETRTLDPIFENASAFTRRAFTAAGAGNCNSLADGGFNASPQIRIQQTTGVCRFGMMEIDLSGAETDWSVVNATIEWDAVASISNSRNCEWGPINIQPSIAADSSDMIVSILSGSPSTLATSQCTSVTSNINTTLTAAGLTDLDAAIDASQSWFGLGYRFDNNARDASDRFSSLGTATVGFEFEYSVGVFNGGPPIAQQAIGLNNSIGVTWLPNNATSINSYTIFNSSDSVTYAAETQTADNSTFYYIDLNGVNGTYRIAAESLNNGTNATTNAAFRDSLPSQITDLTSDGASDNEIILNFTFAGDGSNGINNYEYRFSNDTLVTWRALNDTIGFIYTPISYFKFDGDIHDSMNTTHVLLLDAGTSNFTEGSNSTTNGLSAYFDTATHYDVGIEGNYDFLRTETWTVAAWVNSTSSAITQILGTSNGIAATDTGYRIYHDGNDFVCEFADGAVELSNTNARNIDDGESHFVVCTYDGSSTALVNYVDGIQDTSSTAGPLTASTDSGNNLKIGGQTDDSNLFLGDIDEVRIFDDTLIQQDIDDLFVNNSPPTRANHTGLVRGDTFDYQVRACNDLGCGLWSANVTGSTFHDPTVTITQAQTIVGDAIGLDIDIQLTAGSPAPFTLDILRIDNFSSTEHTNNTDITIAVGQTISYETIYDRGLDDLANQNYTAFFTVNNSTGTDFDFNGTSIFNTGEYDPNYFTSVQGNHQVNYTVQRDSDGDELNLKVNRFPITFEINCNYKQDLFSDGTWSNHTSIGYLNDSQVVQPTRTTIITCYNPDDILFTTLSSGNTNATLAIVDFVGTLGDFAGVNLIFIFIVFLGAIFTGRSAPVGIIIVVASLGTMGVMGFFPDQNNDPIITGVTWGLIVFLAALGVFMGKRFF